MTYERCVGQATLQVSVLKKRRHRVGVAVGFSSGVFLPRNLALPLLKLSSEKTKRGVEHKRHEYKLFLFCFQIIDSPHLFQTRCSKVGGRWSPVAISACRSQAWVDLGFGLLMVFRQID